MSYLELLKLAAPETVLVITVLVVLAADLVALADLELRFRMIIGALITCVGCVVSIGWMLALPEQAQVAGGIFVVDPLNQLVKVALLVLAILTALLSLESSFSPHAGEYFALVLLATLGMMFLVSSNDVL